MKAKAHRERTPAEWLAEVLATDRKGDYLATYDIAERGLAEYPEEISLGHRAALALARIGATEEAQRRTAALVARAHDNEDVATLDARLAKDRAARLTGSERLEALRVAAARYAAIADRPGASHYPAINAATLWFLAGDREASVRRADEAQRRARAGTPDYWSLATEAEAALLLGDVAGAGRALIAARAAVGDDFAALTTTRRQLRLIVEARGISGEVLAPLRAPGVLHYVGHRIDALGAPRRFPRDAEGAVQQRIEAYLASDDAGLGFGSLASGADILCAEALLRRGAKLQVVLPFPVSRFIDVSVAPAGSEWVRRFESCLAGAAGEPLVTGASGDLEDDTSFAYAAVVAMGLALLRSRFLDAPVTQLAVWDGRPATGLAGTAADVAVWRATGQPQRIVELSATGGQRPGRAAANERRQRAILFGDVKGFSRLTEDQIPVFFERVMGALGPVLDSFGDSVRWRNTWGDGLYVVLDDVGSAARCALALQASLAALDLAAMGLPRDLGLRLGAHLGPVYETLDPVLGRVVPCGTHVNRTARIEPIAPVGGVYVTEAFAAALALVDDVHTCEYVGSLPLAKDAGVLRMYVLK